MTSKIVVNNIEPDAGISSVTFNGDLDVTGNLNISGIVTATSFEGSTVLLLGTTTASNAESFRIHTSDSGKAIIKLTNSTTGTAAGDGFEFGMNGNEQIEFVNKENTDMFFATNNQERLRIDSSGHTLPGADNTSDLGSSSKRWRNIYSADLQLSNVGTGGNEVDGTEGKWTLQEAEDTVYMINRITGKRYKIKMEEV